MAKICFVSFEIFPTVKGGAGVLLFNAARLLLPLGHEVIFVLDMPKEEFEQFNEVDRLTLPYPERCRAYFVWGLVQDMKVGRPEFLSDYEYRAYQFYHVARKVYALEKPDVIEFFEYTGSAYHALSAKVAGLDFQDSRLAVRLHGALELIDQMQAGGLLGIDRYVMYGLERQALRLAETVLTPSQNFLDQAYRPNYEAWYGEAVVSQPPLVGWPQAHGEVDYPDGILFFGRLHGIKGVDTFVDAACAYLGKPENPRRQFYLVGYDSEQPPVRAGSYQKYLQRKIPARFKGNFHFSGQLSWDELGKLLPRMLFGVIPSYFESYCYAAHELYEAGLPLIVSDIPGLQSDFQAEKNALVFDGTVSGLAEQIERLSRDAALRARLSRPYPVGEAPLGDFYTATHAPGWMDPTGVGEQPSLLICLLTDQEKLLAASLANLRPLLDEKIGLVVLRPADQMPTVNQRSGSGEETAETVAWFLGKLYAFEDGEGKSLLPTEALTRQAILVLKAGDLVNPGTLQRSLDVLARHKQVNFVTWWKRFRKGKWSTTTTFPLDTANELAPFAGQPVFSRAVMRSQAGGLLVDLFDARAGRYGELAYLWRLDDGFGCGITIPQEGVEYLDDERFDLGSSALEYLLARDMQPWRRRRLARLMLTLKQRQIRLSEHFWIEPQEKPFWRIVRAGFNTLRQSPLNAWLDSTPWLKQGLKKIVAGLRLLPYLFRRKKD